MSLHKPDIKELLQFALEKLSFSGIDTPLVDARIMLCHAAGITNSYIIAHSDAILDDDITANFISWVERRALREPLAYIIGEKEFYGFPFDVTPDVLIPRPETELLVEYSIDFLKAKNNSIAVDIGTGSGAIAVSVLRFVPDYFFYAVDVSEQALEIAVINSKKAGVGDRIKFLCGDVLNPLVGMKCDLIVSNPPYIPSDVISSLEPEVGDHEPLSALDGGSDGLDFYRLIASSAPEILKPGGSLAVEIGIDQAEAVVNLFKTNRFSEIRVKKDYAGIDRIVIGLWI